MPFSLRFSKGDVRPLRVGRAPLIAICVLILGISGFASSLANASEQGQSVARANGAQVNYLKKLIESHENMIWMGHIIPDTDSLAGSMLAAYLHGGRSGVPSPLNPESRFVIDKCDADEPSVVDDFSNMTVGLVDFNQSTQLPAGISTGNILAIIDHHAIGGSPLNIADVISIEIRPWGSTATILADQAELLGVKLPKTLACVGMAAILSDTVNLTSPTTTEYDKIYVQKLAQQAGIDDVDAFANSMLLAKSDLSGLSATDIVLLDYKDFEFAGQKVGIGVAETLTADELITRRYQLKSAIEAQKKASGIDHLIFAIVDTRDQKSYILWGDAKDEKLALSAFGGTVKDDMVVTDGTISRKSQIGPAIQKAVEAEAAK
ncbi:putative manganese-dependent inorganic pyrophosphatase [Pseudovibrio axinellae]|uniref:inorganic diphosphatase n=1 Tax=Pseudovibrio axinellae TaxID=989403 RepID=A0A165VSJ1_9HYPH|nr:manganese-dependent inorganic pyrophosphatase [Pseudovibrio axinellae]KZL15379.1 putative manganese-dependent inorganic pyrophosphatase [Pseudovibrio axinellae]SER53973.1 manganese-dependent inorganic pyrophosphatase [Pseudovibrio axinellae]